MASIKGFVRSVADRLVPQVVAQATCGSWYESCGCGPTSNQCYKLCSYCPGQGVSCNGGCWYNCHRC